MRLPRYLFIWAIVVLVLLSELSNSNVFQLAASGDGDAAHKATTKDSATIPSYNDTRPHAPSGYLCVHGAKGRLNNLILQNLVGVHMAHHLNRTLLVDPEVSKYYDVDRLSLTVYPDSPHRAALEIGRSVHANSGCDHPNRISPYAINHGRTVLERFDDYESQTRGRTLVSVDNSDVWYWLGRPPEAVYGRFFRGLVPRRVHGDKARAFLEEKGLRRPNESFNAVHLRRFEGKCGAHDLDLCCPELQYVQSIIAERGGSIVDPLFVADDGQCPPEVRATYVNATDCPVIVGYDGPCEGTECAVLDFELCVHSDVFVGNLKSSGDMNIREWRRARYGVEGRRSVLSREAEAMALEERTEHLTRYVVGHWRFRPDCNSIGPAQRNKPCV